MSVCLPVSLTNMGKRRFARESALQVLYALEFNDDGPEAALAGHDKEKNAEKAVQEYVDWLVRGIASRRGEIDGLIQSKSKNWRVSRMSHVDRNILRIAVFELLEEKFMAPAIIINEAIEIAKRYSGEEAAVFVNGVLDAVRKKLEEKNPREEVSHDESTKESAKKRILRSGGRRKKE